MVSGRSAVFDTLLESDDEGFSGSMNVYQYANSNPLTFIDSLELNGVLPLPIPMPPPPVNPGGGAGATNGAAPLLFNGSRERPAGRPDRPSERPDRPSDDPWPKENKNFCIRTYAICQNEGWTGNCQSCLDRCLGSRSGNWPFQICHRKMNSCEK